jgi:hypothetical protein
MEKDEILEIAIDQEERLLVKPKSNSFPYMYREAMEVHWDNEGKFLYSPKPKQWRYLDWYIQIIKAAKEQTCLLTITDNTEWVNIPEELKNDIIDYQASV